MSVKIKMGRFIYVYICKVKLVYITSFDQKILVIRARLHDKKIAELRTLLLETYVRQTI